MNRFLRPISQDDIDRQLLVVQELCKTVDRIRLLFEYAGNIYEDSNQGAPLDSIADILRGAVDKKVDGWISNTGGEV